MKAFVLSVSFLLAGLAAFAQTSAITIRSDSPCQIYLVETTIDIDSALKDPAGQYEYQMSNSVKSGGIKTVERMTPLGVTPVTVNLTLGKHELRVDTGHEDLSIMIEATGQPQTWRVDVASETARGVIGWGLAGGLTGMILLNGPSYIESERHQNGFGQIGFEVSGFAVLTVLIGGMLFVHTDAVREK